MTPCAVYHEGEKIGPLNGILCLEENRSYEVVVKEPATTRAWLDQLPLEACAPGCFSLNTGFWVGKSVLHLETPTSRTSIPIRVRPAPNKLDPKAWQIMLSDLEIWLNGVSVGLEGGVNGRITTETGPTPQFLATALLPLVNPLVISLATICQTPRTKDAGYWQDVALRNMHKADRESLAWVTRHPETGAWLLPWVRVDLIGDEPHFPQRCITQTVDHPANRYVVWLARKAEHTLKSTGIALRSMAKSPPVDDTSRWCLNRSRSLLDGAEIIGNIIKRSPLRHVRPHPPSEAALLVVLDDPAYAAFHSTSRLFISPAFSLDQGQPCGAPVRPSYEIYEIWCYLTLVHASQKKWPHWKWQSKGFGHILNMTSSGTGATTTGTAPNGSRIDLAFNPIFPGYFARNNASRYSLSTERRPDITIAWQPVHGDAWWACLDAKYRVGRTNLGDAFSSVHIYRDALIWKKFGGPPRYSFLLAPKASHDCGDWFSETFREKTNRGIWEFSPTGEGGRNFIEWLEMRM
ncbi:nuclease domain-containing protein [Desulfoplanes formicivorans]|uniref:DUF2357 domain-containing protein n=1 Tax=Desulfoplanes formicivorans TaxID=1592317 RepID=A0A194AJQ9_9BACT|nr:nuclease domain-containing protein [Desulfoplanes formicivorans]GAU09291.1 hypothetical protein DPF_2014 [Desulfoplanes formicivorans]